MYFQCNTVCIIKNLDFLRKWTDALLNNQVVHCTDSGTTSLRPNSQIAWYCVSFRFVALFLYFICAFQSSQFKAGKCWFCWFRIFVSRFTAIPALGSVWGFTERCWALGAVSVVCGCACAEIWRCEEHLPCPGSGDGVWKCGINPVLQHCLYLNWGNGSFSQFECCRRWVCLGLVVFSVGFVVGV